MDIVSHQSGEQLVLGITGRLDGQWSDHLENFVDERLRSGHLDIVFDMAGVSFLSSAGIRVIVGVHKKLAAIEGRLVLRNLTQQDRQVLALTGVLAHLRVEVVEPAKLEDAEPAPAGRGAPADDPSIRPHARRSLTELPASETTRFDLFTRDAPPMVCRLQGDPSLLDGCRFSPTDCETLTLGADTIALGLGALGNDFSDSRAFFGEFMAVGGAVACQPADGFTRCDYLVSEGDFTAQIQSLYSVVCQGDFSHLIRFEPIEGKRSIGLTALANAALSLVDTPLACIAIVAESAGLIGAGLRRSPVFVPDAQAPFAFPAMRDWLSFSCERLDAGSTAIVVGVVGSPQHCPPALLPFLRPLGPTHSATESPNDGPNDGPIGHVHGSPFRYRPLPRDAIELQRIVRPFFDGQSAQGVMHLLCDDRVADRIDESAFIRGACWVAPLVSGLAP